MSVSWVIRDAGLSQVRRVAAFLALVLEPGDAVALTGALGAGKTTFARAVIRAVLEEETRDIPSPTFALMQTYEGGRLPLAHIDCYRMDSTDELQEIGLDEALRDGAALIEWADRVAQALPAERLEIALGDGAADDSRTLTLSGHGAWAARLKRLETIEKFCADTAWAEARPVFLRGDASTRAYARLHMNGETVVLMDSPARADGPPLSGGMSYSQLVHLAENVKPFVAIADALEHAGLSAPRILARDLDNGFLIIEDLGDRVFASEPGDKPTLEELYRAATDVLVTLKDHPPSATLSLPDGGAHKLPDFDKTAMMFEAELLLDWFYPAVYREEAADAVRAGFQDALGSLLETVQGKDESWVLRDYHSPNLMWLPERGGIARVGVIDFQDALKGHASYDLVSLLQDARRDIPAELEARLRAHYCDARARREKDFETDAFATAYAVLGAQRNSKILGIFARLAKRDGKHDYLAHIPRVSAYLERNLSHPALAGLRRWFDEHLPAEMRERPVDV